VLARYWRFFFEVVRFRPFFLVLFLVLVFLVVFFFVLFRLLFFALFFGGTFAPFSRASDRPMAIACLRLFTLPPFPPFPLFRVPFFRRRIALATRLPAAFPYLRAPDFFLAAMICSV